MKNRVAFNSLHTPADEIIWDGKIPIYLLTVHVVEDGDYQDSRDFH